MNQLAAAAGVHVSTVSRALRGQESIPGETRRRIQQLAERLGYRPDPMLNALCAYRKSLAGIRHPPTLAIVATRPTWQEDLANRLYCEGARERAFELGYQTEVFVLTPSHLSGKRLAGILSTRGIRGVVSLPLADVTIPIDFPWERFIVVATGYKLRVPHINRVSINHFSAIRDALLNLRSLGYRRPGLVLRDEGPNLAPDGTTYVNNLWKGGYLAEASKLYPDLRIPVIQLGDCRTLARWLTRHRPDVIVSQRRDIARLLPSSHAGTPIAYTMVDDNETLTGIHQNSRHVGRHAVNLLAAALQEEARQEHTVPVTLLVEARWQPGSTAIRREVAV